MGALPVFPEAVDHALFPIPAYTRLLYELMAPGGDPPRQGAIIVSPADLWPHWPEAYNTQWSVLEIGVLVIALKVEDLVPAR